MTSTDLIQRNKPDSYARYMRANPLYFEGLFRVSFSERNLARAVRTMFPGRPFERRREDMANKPGFCTNCKRGPMGVRNHLCGTCERAAGTLTGKFREEALEEIRERIDRGEVKPRGRHKKSLESSVGSIGSIGSGIKADNGGAFSAASQAALNKGVEEKARQRAESGAAAPGSLRDVPGKVEAQLRGLLRLIDETAKMGLATKITVSITIGGAEA